MRVAVLGAGYAGLTLAHRLEDRLPAEAELVVVNDRSDHLVQHELHRVVRRPGLAEAITLPLDEVLDRAELRVARVESVDPEASRAALADGALDYDYAAVCLGAETAYYGLPGVEERATPLKRLDHARRIRERTLAVCADAGAGADGGRIVVGGAGLSGVQVAGELAALAREEGSADRVDVLLLEREGEVAPTFPPNFRRAVRDELDARGVTVRTGAAVRRATDAAIELRDAGGDGGGHGGEKLDYDQFVWTGGIAGSAAMGGDRPTVRGDLRLTPSTFVVGDAARAVDADGAAVPASASAAVRQARTVADGLVDLVAYDLGGRAGFEPRLDPYRFDVPGWIVSIGDGAVAQVGPTVLTGGAARAMKASVGAGYLSSVRAVSRAAKLVEEELR